MKKRGIFTNIITITIIFLISGVSGLFLFQESNDLFSVITGKAGIIEPTEDDPNAPSGGGAYCGDGNCGIGEDSSTCCIDCGCPEGEECAEGFCFPVYSPPGEPNCGINGCQPELGETCSTCEIDCGVCTSPTLDDETDDTTYFKIYRETVETETIEETEEPQLYEIEETQTLITNIAQGDIIQIFGFNGDFYELKAETVSDFSIVFKSENLVMVTKIGDTTQEDLDKDGKDDIKISYEKILTDNKAKTRIEIIEKEIIPVYSPELIQKSTYKSDIIIYFIIIVSILTIIAAIIKRLIDLNKTKKHLK